MTIGGIKMRWSIGALLVLCLTATACTGSATVTQTGSDANDDRTEPVPAQVDATEPPSTLANNEPTTDDPAVDEQDLTPTPAGPPAVLLSNDAFRTDSVLGLSHDGAFAYAATSSPWDTPTSCDNAAVESLAVADVVAAEAGDLTVAAAGLEQVGDVRQMIFNNNGTAAVLSSCQLSDADSDLWLQRAEIASDGRIISLGEPIGMNANGESSPHLLRWVDDDIVEVRVTIEEDGGDVATWIVENRQLSIVDGQVISSERFDLFEDDGFGAGRDMATSQGFTYRVIDDPAGGLGCEGFGVAKTLELDTGGERRLALTQPELVFSGVHELQTTPSGYITWTSGCEGFVSAYVGRVLADGTIADAHLIDAFSTAAGVYVDYRYYRLTGDGFLNGVGQSFDDGADEPTPAFLRYDLNLDPHFVNTADPAPQIDQEPVATAVDEDATWHVGDTLAAEPACGSRTLYGQTPGGFFRAFPAGFEIDAIVDVDFGDTRRIRYPEWEWVSRTIVVQTECPGSYEGRRVWFGVENDPAIWGFGLDRADLGEVADVLAVRDVLQDGTDFVETSIVQVELLDGSVADIELIRLPDDS